MPPEVLIRLRIRHWSQTREPSHIPKPITGTSEKMRGEGGEKKSQSTGFLYKIHNSITIIYKTRNI